MAYSLYALGVQFGGPIAPVCETIIQHLGWRASFQFVALAGFLTLGISLLSWDEPERGRFDIAQSVLVNPDQSMKTGSQAFGAYSLETPKDKLNIRFQKKDEKYCEKLREYFKALKELFFNNTANWILLAACLRTQ